MSESTTNLPSVKQLSSEQLAVLLHRTRCEGYKFCKPWSELPKDTRDGWRKVAEKLDSDAIAVISSLAATLAESAAEVSRLRHVDAIAKHNLKTAMPGWHETNVPAGIYSMSCLLIGEQAENERLKQRLLTAAGDDLCRLSQEEIKDLTGGNVPIPPQDEFLASCKRFHSQIAGEAGVNQNCLTLAQLVAENERLTRYEKELEQLGEFMQSRHPVGELKHIGLLEAVEAAKQVILEQEAELAALRAPGDDVTRNGVEAALAGLCRHTGILEPAWGTASPLAPEIIREAIAKFSELQKAKEAAERERDTLHDALDKAEGHACDLAEAFGWPKPVHYGEYLGQLPKMAMEVKANRTRLAEVERAAVQLIATAKQVAGRLKAMPFVNDRAHGGMLLQHAVNLEEVIRTAPPAAEPGSCPKRSSREVEPISDISGKLLYHECIACHWKSIEPAAPDAEVKGEATRSQQIAKAAFVRLGIRWLDRGRFHEQHGFDSWNDAHAWAKHNLQYDIDWSVVESSRWQAGLAKLSQWNTKGV